MPGRRWDMRRCRITLATLYLRSLPSHHHTPPHPPPAHTFLYSDETVVAVCLCTALVDAADTDQWEVVFELATVQEDSAGVVRFARKPGMEYVRTVWYHQGRGTEVVVHEVWRRCCD